MAKFISHYHYYEDKLLGIGSFSKVYEGINSKTQ